MLRVTGLASAGLAGMATMGCSSGSRRGQQPTTAARSTEQPAEKPQPGGTLSVYATASAPLDFQRTTAQASSDMAGAVLSRLLRYKTGLDPHVTADYELANDLAIHAESPDGTIWTFKLRPEAKFHNVPPVNGHPVEAEDIKATFVRALQVKSPNRGALGMIDASQIETPAKDTVVFKLKYTYASFNTMVAAPKYSWIYPREVLSGDYDPSKVLIGSGPFIFASFSPSVEYVFKKNPDWFEKGQPYVDSLHAAIIPSDAQRLAQFTAGHLDTVGPNQNDLETAKRSNPSAMVLNYFTSSGGGYPLYFQLGDPNSPFQDIRLRRAVSLAIDRDAINKAIYDGKGEAAFVVPPGMGKWALKMNDLPSSTAQFFKYSPNEAKKLVDAAGAGNTEFKLRYITGFQPFGDLYRTQSGMINNMLNAVGIKTALLPADYVHDYVGGGKGIRVGNFPSDNIIFTGISTLASPDEFIFGYLDSKSTVNLERLHDSQLDAMIQKSRAELNEANRVKAILDIQKYVADKMYIVNGFPQGEAHTMVQPWDHNYQLSITGGAMTETWSKAWLKK